MALPKLTNVKIVKGKGKLAGRHCVTGQASKKAPGFKGRGSTKRFVGCFISETDAVKRAVRVSGGDFDSSSRRVRRAGAGFRVTRKTKRTRR